MDLLNLSVVAEYYPVLLRGFGMTILMTLIVITLSLTLAIPVALSRMSGNFLVRLVGGTYVELLRGTPLVLQLVYIYFVLPGVGIRLDGFVAALVALTLHYTAYLSEVYRAGIQSVPKGQTQAASALGMSRGQTFIRIVLPQAVAVVEPGGFVHDLVGGAKRHGRGLDGQALTLFMHCDKSQTLPAPSFPAIARAGSWTPEAASR